MHVRRATAAVAAVVLAITVRAQGGCGQPGVDWAIELSTPTNVAASAGVDALAVSFRPLNLGTVPAPDDPSSAEHPVFAVALYRFSVIDGASRLEPLGASWVRHVTIPPLSQGLHCTCTPAGAAELGPGCNDVLSASGSMLAANLGPRTAVDPLSGTFAFPFATPAPGGPHPGLLQFAASDVTTGAGERYVLEAHVVAAADAGPTTAPNNATWMELSVGGTVADRTFQALGGTHRGETALDAWKSFDPGVELAEIAVPGQGRFQLAARATQLASGDWRYAYALYDRDCARAAGAFAVPLPVGAVPVNLAFRDLAYHDGDGVGGTSQSGADWSASVTGSSVAWASLPFATSPNANALRWGTAYAFAFDHPRPPMPGTVTVGLFAPGTPTEIAAGAPVPLDLDVLADPFCFGDGLGTPCPCGNHSPFGHGEGCTSSLGTGGHVRVDGDPSVAHDTVALVGTQMTNATALYLQGTSPGGGGAGSVLGDGLLCIDGALVRLGSLLNVAGASSYPGPAQAPVSVRGAVLPGATYTYQVWYRNAALFCTSATFNLTNGVALTWVP